MNTIANESPYMRISLMIVGTKLRNWINTLNNGERNFLYADAGEILTQYGLPNLVEGLLNGGLEDFVLHVSRNVALTNYFTNLASSL
jgi:hypothetical protein